MMRPHIAEKFASFANKGRTLSSKSTDPAHLADKHANAP